MAPEIEWRNIRVSNPTPTPMERVTVTGELWLVGPWPFPDRPAVDDEVTLIWDTALAGKDRTDESGRFSIPFDAPLEPSLYTYVLSRTDPFWPGLPNYYITIEVLSEFVCEWCGSIFTSGELLAAHKAICPYRPVEFTCPWCAIVFATEEALEIHKRVCPRRPDLVIPAEWQKVLLFGSLGLIGVGVLWAVMKHG